MSQKILTELTLYQKTVLYFRGRIILMFFILLIIYNRGHNFETIKNVVSMAMFKHWRLDAQGRPFGPDTLEYRQLFNLQTFDCLANTVCIAFMSAFVALSLNWLLFRLNVPNPQKENRDEIEGLRLWKQNEIKSLDAQGRLVRTLQKDQIVKETTLETIERLETLLLRYEQNAIALTPGLNKAIKDRPKQDKFADLFDQLEQPTEKQKRSRERTRRISVKFKT